MNKSNTYFNSIFVLACLLLSASTHALEPASDVKLTPITVQVNWNHQYQFAGLYAAIKQGYYQKAGLDVEVKSWRPNINVVEEVVSGRADFATGYSLVVADYAKGAPISLVMASFQFSPMVLLSHEPIHDLKQLSGMTVMQNGNLQINGLIDKANTLVDQELIKVPTSGDLNDFINRKVDLYSAFKTNEPYRLYQQGVPYYVLDPKTFGIQSYGDLIFTHQDKARFSPEQVSAFKKATILGWEYAIQHQPETVDYILKNYSVKKSRDALLAEAEATTMFVKSGTNPIGQVEVGKLMANVVQAKESGFMTQEQLDEFDMKAFIFNPQTLHFTEQERDYLKSHPVIKIANDINWEPFDFINKSGEWSGMAADYFEIFERVLGVKFEFDKNRPWAQTVEAVKRQEVSVVSTIVMTDERQGYLKFTAPYLSFPMVLATSNSVSFIEDTSQLRGKTLAVGRGYWSHDLFKTLHPSIKLEVVDSVQAGLEAVLSGKAYAYAGNIVAINHTIKKFGFTNLHIAGQMGKPFDLSIGVQKNNPILFSILDKALDSITEAQRNEIYNRWIQLEVLNKTDRSVWITTVLIALAVFTVLIISMVLLQIKKRSQQVYITQINELTLATYTNAHTRKMEWASDSFVALTGYSREELFEQPQDVLRHPDIDAQFYEAIWLMLMAGKTWRGELCARGKAGLDYWVDAVITPAFSHSKLKGFWTTRIDITDKKHLQEVVIRDPLTGAFNRRHFNERFEVELNRASRKGEPFALATFDIDFFKAINDFYGHQRGDEVLQQVVKSVLQYTQRAGDLVFRVGGEEFMVFSDLQSHEAFFNYLELLRESVEALAIPNPKAELKTLTISIGGVFCNKASQADSASLYSLVDKALYEAKHQGRNQVVMHVI